MRQAVMPPSGYRRLEFVEFVVERQRVLERRRAGLPPAEWTSDAVLGLAKFCCIDRRDDAVTCELLMAVQARPTWCTERKALLCAALRFTISRRGEAEKMAALIDLDWAGASKALEQALCDGSIRCGVGTYQMCLSRAQVSTKLRPMARSLIDRLRKQGKLGSIACLSDFLADAMAHRSKNGTKRPQFSANETAKDLAYFGCVAADGDPLCHLGPGARKGMALVREAGGGAAGAVGVVDKVGRNPKRGRPGCLLAGELESEAGAGAEVRATVAAAELGLAPAGGAETTLQRPSAAAVDATISAPDLALVDALCDQLRHAGLGWATRVDVEQARVRALGSAQDCTGVFTPPASHKQLWADPQLHAMDFAAPASLLAVFFLKLIVLILTSFFIPLASHNESGMEPRTSRHTPRPSHHVLRSPHPQPSPSPRRYASS
jgi:hypothetical protein